MPTTPEDFKTLDSAFKSNNIEQVEKILQNFDVTATDEWGSNCLMLGCNDSSSPKVMKVVFDKIDETGGTELLKSQLTATDKDGSTVLMYACNYCPDSLEVMKLIFENIDKAGGKALLKQQLTATTNLGSTCLLLCCSNCSSVEVMKLMLEKIVEAGGPELLKSELVATNNYGKSCLLFFLTKSSSSEVMKVIAVFLFYLGLFEEQYAKFDTLDCRGKEGESREHKERLKNETGINSSSWTPESYESIRLLSDIKLLSNIEYLKDFPLLSKKNKAGETFLDVVCKSGQYDTLALLVSNILPFGRSVLRKVFESQLPNILLSTECIFSREFDSVDEKKLLQLVMELSSVTGLFEELYSQFDEGKKKTLSRICNIESGEWIRPTSTDSTMGEIKKSIINNKVYLVNK